MNETTRNQTTESESSFKQEFTVAGNQVVDTVKSLIAKGNVRSIVVKKDGRTLVELPLTVGIVGTLLAPQIALLGVVVAMIAQCSIEIRYHGEPNQTA
ncbi:MAG TPA: DUF4342 domain-containing protein [Chloroflexota bacterium]|nr:DUF4342 domain-containing protein [Chloroflexota bacterium]